GSHLWQALGKGFARGNETALDQDLHSVVQAALDLLPDRRGDGGSFGHAGPRRLLSGDRPVQQADIVETVALGVLLETCGDDPGDRVEGRCIYVRRLSTACLGARR